MNPISISEMLLIIVTGKETAYLLPTSVLAFWVALTTFIRFYSKDTLQNFAAINTLSAIMIIAAGNTVFIRWAPASRVRAFRRTNIIVIG
jgi:hypothetical protein